MKKAKTNTVSMSLAQLKERKPSSADLVRLRKLAALPDDEIDTTDIAEFTDLAGGTRGQFYRPLTQPIKVIP